MAVVASSRRSIEWQATAVLGGSAGIGLGVGMMINADLGVTPADVTNTGLADHLGIGVGTIAWLFATTVSLGAWALGRTPSVGTFVSALLIGMGVNASVSMVPTPDAVAAQVAMLVAGLTFLYVGIVSIVASGRGTGPLELLMLAISDRGMKLHVARWSIEGTLVVIGVALGGQIGVGTALFAVMSGPTLAWLLPPAVRWMGTEQAVPLVAAVF